MWPRTPPPLLPPQWQQRWPRAARRRPNRWLTWPLLLRDLVFDGGDRCDCADLVVECDAHDDHALCLPADLRDRPHPRAQHHAARADDEDLLVGIADDPHRGELPDAISDLEREHALAGPVVHRVIGDRRPLAVTALRDDEQVA